MKDPVLPKKGERWIQYRCEKNPKHLFFNVGEGYTFTGDIGTIHLLGDLIYAMVECGCFRKEV